MSISPRLSNLLAYNCSLYSLIFFSISVVSVISPLFFLISLACYWFFFFFLLVIFIYFFLIFKFHSADFGICCSNSFRWLERLFIWDFSCFFFWGRTILLWTSLWELLLLHPIDFVILCFHFPLSQGIFQFLLRFHFWLISFLVACCLASTYLFFSHFSFCSWFLISYHCAQKRSFKLHVSS